MDRVLSLGPTWTVEQFAWFLDRFPLRTAALRSSLRFKFFIMIHRHAKNVSSLRSLLQ